MNIDPVNVLIVAPIIAAALYVAWLSASDAITPLPCDSEAETVRLCLAWEPPEEIHATVSVCLCHGILITLRGIDIVDSSGLAIVRVEIGESRVSIHDRPDEAVEEFMESGGDFERMFNLRGEWN